MPLQCPGRHTKAATLVPTQQHYNAKIREVLAAIGLQATHLLTRHMTLACSVIDNKSEPNIGGEVYITAKVALIFDYRRARHIEVCR